MSKLPEPAHTHEHGWQSCTWGMDGIKVLEDHIQKVNYYTVEQLEQYAKDYSAALQSRIDVLEAAVIAMRDEGIEKIMAMSEDQINALNRLKGSNPDDIARIGKQACELALKEVESRKLKAELADCRKDAERIEHLENFVIHLQEQGFKWNSFTFVAGSTARQQIDAAIAAGGVE